MADDVHQLVEFRQWVEQTGIELDSATTQGMHDSLYSNSDAADAWEEAKELSVNGYEYIIWKLGWDHYVDGWMYNADSGWSPEDRGSQDSYNSNEEECSDNQPQVCPSDIEEKGRSPEEKRIIDIVADRKGEEWAEKHSELILAQASLVGELQQEGRNNMSKDNSEPSDVATPPEVLNTIESLPDEKISAGRIKQELDESITDFADALHELILLGEVELCQRRGTGPRVWFKHRSSADSEPPGRVSDSVWRCYVAQDSTTRFADRIFHDREDAIEHLSRSAVVEPESFDKVPYLDDVWRAETSGFEGHEEVTAVVRKEPVYTQKPEPSSESKKEEKAKRRDNETPDETQPQTTLSEIAPGTESETGTEGTWTYYYEPEAGEGWSNLQTGEVSHSKMRPGQPPEDGDGYGDWLSGWTQPPDAVEQLTNGQLLEVQLADREPELAVVMNTAGDNVSIRTEYPDHLFAGDDYISVLAVEDTDAESVDVPEWAEPYRDG